MGIFDGIINAVTSPTGVGAIISGGLGLLGASQQQDFQAGQAQQAQNFSAQQVAQQEAFQEEERVRQYGAYREARQTGYQDTVKDLAAAGLNPMLAYSQGPSGAAMGTAPSGSSASGVAAPGVNKFGAGIQTAAQVANIDLIQSQAEKNRAEATKATEELPVLRGQVGVQNVQMALMRQQAEQSNAMTSLTDAQRKQVYAAIEKIVAETQNVDADTLRTRADTILKQAMTGNTQVDTVLKNLDVPKAKNEAEAQSSWYMKNVAPYTGELGKITSSAVGARQAIKPGGKISINPTTNTTIRK